MTQYKVEASFKGKRVLLPEVYDSATAAAIAAEELEGVHGWKGVTFDWAPA